MKRVGVEVELQSHSNILKMPLPPTSDVNVSWLLSMHLLITSTSAFPVQDLKNKTAAYARRA